MNSRGIIILGSARSDGNTRLAAQYLSKAGEMAMADLNDYRIEPFEYDNYSRSDDFIPLMRKVFHDEPVAIG